MKRLMWIPVVLSAFVNLGPLQAFASEDGSARCNSLETVQKLRDLGSKNKGRIYVYNVMDMFQERIRTAIREYYTVAKTCPTREVVMALVQEYQSVGYPNQYLPSVVSSLNPHLGLKTFEIGDSWNKTPINDEIRETPDGKALFNNIAIMGLNREKDPAKLSLYSVGTGFVIGREGQKLYIGTARHVVAENAEKISFDKVCSRFAFHFPVLGHKHFYGSKLLVERQDIDFAICELELPEGEAQNGELNGLELSTLPQLPQDLALSTAGFNSHNKEPGKVHIDQGDDCRLFMKSSEVRKVEDTTWALPSGCDVASGDSGSPVINRATQELLGVVVKTSIVKSGMSSQELKKLQTDPNLKEALWQELSLFVPMMKIRDVLCPTADMSLKRVLRCE